LFQIGSRLVPDWFQIEFKAKAVADLVYPVARLSVQTLAVIVYGIIKRSYILHIIIGIGSGMAVQ
jgi:hypothetical protein